MIQLDSQSPRKARAFIYKLFNDEMPSFVSREVNLLDEMPSFVSRDVNLLDRLFIDSNGAGENSKTTR